MYWMINSPSSSELPVPMMREPIIHKTREIKEELLRPKKYEVKWEPMISKTYEVKEEPTMYKVRERKELAID